MPVTLKDVENVAKLARLRFKEEEKKKFTEQINRILEYIDKLNELDTSKIEPLSHTIEISNVFREDEVTPSFPNEEILKNAPQKKGNYFVVPKVINQ
jgi:aspartyl-tRNA(Asn)/glutamyl-tRNA(Gln) amidotransferase subunit C